MCDGLLFAHFYQICRTWDKSVDIGQVSKGCGLLKGNFPRIQTEHFAHVIQEKGNPI